MDKLLIKCIKWLFEWLGPSHEEIRYEMQERLFERQREELCRKRELDQLLLDILTKGWKNVNK